MFEKHDFSSYLFIPVVFTYRKSTFQLINRDDKWSKKHQSTLNNPWYDNEAYRLKMGQGFTTPAQFVWRR